MLNNGTVSIACADRLALTGGTHGVLHDGGTLSGGGTLHLGDGTALAAIGHTTFADGTTLSLDGTGARFDGQWTDDDRRPWRGQ